MRSCRLTVGRDDGDRFENSGDVVFTAFFGFRGQSFEDRHAQELDDDRGREVSRRFHREAVHEHRVRFGARATLAGLQRPKRTSRLELLKIAKADQGTLF